VADAREQHPTDRPTTAATAVLVAAPAGADETATLPLPAERTHTLATDVALVASFAAFVAVGALFSIPTGTGVPITLQTLAVILAGLVLGPRRGALAVLLYLGVGVAGVPVFAEGTSGLAVLAGVTGGYLVAFPLAAAVAGLLASAARQATGLARYLVLVASGITASALVVHPLGIANIAWRAGLSAEEAFRAGAIYFPGDVVKNLLAAAVAVAVFAHYPDLLRRRR